MSKAQKKEVLIEQVLALKTKVKKMIAIITLYQESN